MKRLLCPHGGLFSTLLHLQATDPITKFEVPISEFGIEAVETTASPNTKPAVQQDIKKIKLDYCEFFYFHLFKIVTSIPVKEAEKTFASPGGFFRAKSFYRRIFEGVGSVEKNCRWLHDLIADTYLDILESHLEFALPTTSKDHIFAVAQFRNKSQSAARLSEALIGLICQLWLGGNRPIRALKPTIDMIHAIETVVKHVCTSICQTQPFSNRYYSQSVESSFASIRLDLYQFLKASLRELPLEPHYSGLVSLWKTYVTPWSYVKTEQSEYWHPYVLNNYLYYVVIFNEILDQLEANFEALVSLQLRTKLVLQGGDFANRLKIPLECLLAVIKSVIPVLDLLKNVEISESGPKRFSQYSEFRLQDQLAVLEPDMRTMPSSFDQLAVNRAMNLIRWMERAHSILQQDLRLSGILLEVQDELAHVFSISDVDYEAFLKSQDALEEAEAESNKLTPRRRKLIPATPESRFGALHSIKLDRRQLHYSDEVPILVEVFAWCSAQLNHLSALLLRRIDAPAWIVHYTRLDLRWLAVWQNLLFVLLSPIILGLIFKIVF